MISPALVSTFSFTSFSCCNMGFQSGPIGASWRYSNCSLFLYGFGTLDKRYFTLFLTLLSLMMTWSIFPSLLALWIYLICFILLTRICFLLALLTMMPFPVQEPQPLSLEGLLKSFSSCLFIYWAFSSANSFTLSKAFTVLFPTRLPIPSKSSSSLLSNNYLS